MATSSRILTGAIVVVLLVAASTTLLTRARSERRAAPPDAPALDTVPVGAGGAAADTTSRDTVVVDTATPPAPPPPPPPAGAPATPDTGDQGAVDAAARRLTPADLRLEGLDSMRVRSEHVVRALIVRLRASEASRPVPAAEPGAVTHRVKGGDSARVCLDADALHFSLDTTRWPRCRTQPLVTHDTARFAWGVVPRHTGTGTLTFEVSSFLVGSPRVEFTRAFPVRVRIPASPVDATIVWAEEHTALAVALGALLAAVVAVLARLQEIVDALRKLFGRGPPPEP